MNLGTGPILATDRVHQTKEKLTDDKVEIKEFSFEEATANIPIIKRSEKNDQDDNENSIEENEKAVLEQIDTALRDSEHKKKNQSTKNNIELPELLDPTEAVEFQG